jgi:hypothetical protein
MRPITPLGAAALIFLVSSPVMATNCITTVACVIGQNSSTGASSDIGVEGLSQHGFGLVGVTSANPSAASGRVAGLYGKDQGATPYNSGVSAFSQNGTGLIGFGVNGAGVVGITGAASPESYGIFGIDEGSNSLNQGVAGFSTNAYGVFGTSVNGSGVTGFSTNSYGVFATSSGAVALDADGTGANSVAIFATGGEKYPTLEVGTVGPGYIMAGFNDTNSQSTPLVFAFDGLGNELITGSLTTSGGTFARTQGTNGVDVASYGSRSAVPTLEDFGQGSLRQGYGHVSLDPTYASTIDTRSYLVFVTPHGDSHGLYTVITANGFDVHENEQGRSTISFDYRIVGKPLDMLADTRLPSISTLPQFTSASRQAFRKFKSPAAFPSYARVKTYR